MRDGKFYAYLDVERAYELHQGNLNAVGQIFEGESFLKTSAELVEGERYIHLMELSQLLNVIDGLRLINFLSNGEGGVICEFELSDRTFEKGMRGYSLYKQMQQGLYCPAVEQVMFKPSDLAGKFTGNFVFDLDCRYKPDEIIKMFKNQHIQALREETAPKSKQ